jgi:hypothetical protein
LVEWVYSKWQVERYFRISTCLFKTFSTSNRTDVPTEQGKNRVFYSNETNKIDGSWLVGWCGVVIWTAGCQTPKILRFFSSFVQSSEIRCILFIPFHSVWVLILWVLHFIHFRIKLHFKNAWNMLFCSPLQIKFVKNSVIQFNFKHINKKQTRMNDVMNCKEVTTPLSLFYSILFEIVCSNFESNQRDVK